MADDRNRIGHRPSIIDHRLPTREHHREVTDILGCRHGHPTGVLRLRDWPLTSLVSRRAAASRVREMRTMSAADTPHTDPSLSDEELMGQLAAGRQDAL